MIRKIFILISLFEVFFPSEVRATQIVSEGKHHRTYHSHSVLVAFPSRQWDQSRTTPEAPKSFRFVSNEILKKASDLGFGTFIFNAPDSINGISKILRTFGKSRSSPGAMRAALRSNSPFSWVVHDYNTRFWTPSAFLVSQHGSHQLKLPRAEVIFLLGGYWALGLHKVLASLLVSGDLPLKKEIRIVAVTDGIYSRNLFGDPTKILKLSDLLSEVRKVAKLKPEWNQHLRDYYHELLPFDQKDSQHRIRGDYRFRFIDGSDEFRIHANSQATPVTVHFLRSDQINWRDWAPDPCPL